MSRAWRGEGCAGANQLPRFSRGHTEMSEDLRSRVHIFGCCSSLELLHGSIWFMSDARGVVSPGVLGCRVCIPSDTTLGCKMCSGGSESDSASGVEPATSSLQSLVFSFPLLLSALIWRKTHSADSVRLWNKPTRCWEYSSWDFFLYIYIHIYIICVYKKG